MASLAAARSLLFVPGDRPERFAKAADSGADSIVIDLEDAVPVEAKEAARGAAAAWLAGGHAGIVRINAAGTPWHAADMAMLAGARHAAVMLPKADAEATAAVLSALESRPLVALVESVKGYMALPRLAAVQGLVRIAFGSIDFATESGIEDAGEAMTAIRTRIVLESCHAGIAPPIDGVSVALDDQDLLRHETLRARQFGFGGKLCIHPRQVAVVNALFRPSDEELAWARRAVDASTRSHGGATSVDGSMVDKPVLDRALRIIAERGEAPS